MELEAYYALLRKNYQKVMDRFVYQGKESEAKERLRYLLSNQLVHISYFSPET